MNIGIYQFVIKDYGIYVSQSYNIKRSIRQQIEILNDNYHHCLVLQKLWNLYKDNIKIEEVLYVDNINSLNIASHNYRKTLPFTIDSLYPSSPVKHNLISRRYKNNKFLYLSVDSNQIVHVFNEKEQKIGLEITNEILVSSWYRVVYTSTLRRINYVPQ